MTRELVLVRHGEALANVAGVFAGITCQGLTERGGQQADLVARRLADEHQADPQVTYLYVSPVRRARQTGYRVAEQLDVEPILDNELRAPDPGPLADGHAWDEVRRRWPADPDHPTRPLVEGGESWRRYTERTHARLDAILSHHPGGRAIIVAHSETVVSLLTLLAGVRGLPRLGVYTAHTGITRVHEALERPGVVVGGRRWALMKHNDTTHLTPHLTPRR